MANSLSQYEMLQYETNPAIIGNNALLSIPTASTSASTSSATGGGKSVFIR